ncbi:MAG: hypothetical protein AAB562_00930, partial [Patescibacteria group bacterium]
MVWAQKLVLGIAALLLAGNALFWRSPMLGLPVGTLWFLLVSYRFGARVLPAGMFLPRLAAGTLATLAIIAIAGSALYHLGGLTPAGIIILLAALTLFALREVRSQKLEARIKQKSEIRISK